MNDYRYVDGQMHQLTFRPVMSAAMRPYVVVDAEDTAIGGDIASMWLTLDQAHTLDRHLSAGIACELADHTGDTLTVTGSDDFTTFTVTRQADDDDDRATVPVVAPTFRLPEIRRALTAAVERAQPRATPSAAPDAPCAHESWDVTGEHRTDAGWVKSRKCNDCDDHLDPITEAEPHWDIQPAAPAKEQAEERAAAEFDAGTALLVGEQVTAFAASVRAQVLATRRVLTPNEHDRAWHAIEGSAGEEGADPGTVLNAVLRALDIDAPTAAEEQRRAPAEQPCTDPRHTGPIRAQLGCTGPDPAAEQPAPLTAAERQFLTFALDEAADEMALRDGFTDGDTAALEKFRRMAAAPTTEAQR